MAPTIGLVAAMPAEARALAGRRGWRSRAGFPIKTLSLDTVRLVCAHSGVGRDKAHAAGLLLAEMGAQALGSVGIAGGLAPEIRPGCLVAAQWLRPANLEADPAPIPLADSLAHDLALAGLDSHLGGLACLDAQARTRREKTALFQATGASACDMESLGPARAALETGLPFFALKAVADPADRDLPRAASLGMDDQGRTRALPVLAHLARHPGELPALIRLAKDFNAALTALNRAVPILAQTLA